MGPERLAEFKKESQHFMDHRIPIVPGVPRTGDISYQVCRRNLNSTDSKYRAALDR